MTILHVSDLHFGPHFVPRVGESLLRIAPRLAPDAIVVSGDLTHRAKPQQFIDARRFLDELPPAPRVLVPGNHDVPLYRVWERLKDPHGEYRKHICPDLDHVHRLPGAALVALDSTAPYRSTVNGRIRNSQLDLCRRVFQGAADEDARVVVAHHHFAPAPDYERDQTMPGAKRAMNLFVELGVDLILGGHLHRAYIGNSLDVYSGAERERGVIIVQCGTTTSRRGRAREREKNSFNVVRIGAEMLRVTHYMYFDDVGEFAPLSRHIFPRPGRRFVERHDLFSRPDIDSGAEDQ